MNMTREGYEIMEMLITSEALLEIVERHFDRIRPAQRIMFSNGLWDMKFKTDLLEMFIQLVQTLSTDVLKRVSMKKFADSKNHLRAIRAVLEESIADIFAKALNIEAQPLDLDQHSRNLTEMLESEVSQKVNSVLLLASGESQQTVNIDSNLSTVEAGFKMVDEAKHCLKACFISQNRPNRSKSLNITQEAKQESNACGDSETAVKKSHCKCCFLNFAKMLFNELTSSVLYLGNSETGPAPQIDFNNLREDVEELFEEMDFMYRPDSNQRFQDFLMKEEIDWFYRQLTDRLNDHLQMTGSHLKPTSPLMKKLSDSVLTVKPGSDQSLSPQLLYFMVEDEVAKIIQKLLYFMQNPPEDNHPRYDIFEIPMRQPNSPVSTKPLPTEPDQFNCERFARAHWVIRALLITIYNRRPTRNEEFTAIVKRVTQKIWNKIDVPETCIPTENLCKIIKPVMKDLLKEFGTYANLLASAQNPTNTHFDAAALKYLKHHLDLMEKSSVDRFFSHIWKKISSPLRTFSI